jgi:hypothetical protein
MSVRKPLPGAAKPVDYLAVRGLGVFAVGQALASSPD